MAPTVPKTGVLSIARGSDGVQLPPDRPRSLEGERGTRIFSLVPESDLDGSNPAHERREQPAPSYLGFGAARAAPRATSASWMPAGSRCYPYRTENHSRQLD